MNSHKQYNSFLADRTCVLKLTIQHMYREGELCRDQFLTELEKNVLERIKRNSYQPVIKRERGGGSGLYSWG